MTEKIMPKYPIFIPSRSRFDKCLTAQVLVADGVPFNLVVERQEYDEYARRFGEHATIIVLPFDNIGVEQLVAVRNWIKDYSTAQGDERHWQIDDNLQQFDRRWKGKRMRCAAGVALRATEDFVDRYENVAIAGLNYTMFANIQGGKRGLPPFHLNCHVYSCTLVWNKIPNRFRGPRNEDVDMCLQVLADGWCTIQMNAFLARKVRTMTMPGGNSHIYQDDGRLKMSKVLERAWPGVVETDRRFQRPHHVVAHNWRRFDTPLKRKPGMQIEPGVNEYGMKLEQTREIKSKRLMALVAPLLEEKGSE